MSDLMLVSSRRSGLRRIQDVIRSYWKGPVSMKDPALAKLFGSRPAASGVPVDELIALTYSAVWDAVQQISGDTAKLPLAHIKIGQNGWKEPYRTSRLFKLVHDRPNPETSSLVFRRTLTAHALTWGNGYAEIERDFSGRPLALWQLTPNRVEVKREQLPNGKLGAVRYVVDRQEPGLAAGDVLHIQGIGFDGTLGYNVIMHARQAIGLALAMERFGSTFFANGSTFGGVLSTDQELDDAQKADVQAAIETLHQSVDKAHRFLVLGGGFKFEKLAAAPSESQMDAARNAQIDEVARYFNMPVHKLKKLDRATFSNIEQQDLEYYKGPILTWTKVWEEELNAKLISPLEYGRQYFKHNVSGFLRGDIKSRYDALGVARDKGIINADEWRELEDWNPQPDGQGQVYLVQAAQIPVAKLIELTDAQIAKTKQEAQPSLEPVPVPSDQDVQDANARAAKAEQLLEETDGHLRDAREKLAAVEASGQATTEHVQVLRRQVEQEQAAVLESTALSASLRADAEQVRIAYDSARQREVERKSADDARAAQFEQEIETLRVKNDAAYALLEDARTEMQAVDARYRTAQDEATAARVELANARAVLESVQASVEATLQARIVAEARAASFEALAAERAAAAVQAIEELACQKETLARHETDHVAELERARRADDGRVSDQVAAHRALYADIMRRMVAREIDRAHAAKATPEKFTRWLDTFYDGHEELMTTALQPAVAVHVAFLGSTEDPTDLARALARAHIADSTRQMRAVLDGDADELAPALAPLFLRWEADRAAQFADRLMAKEIAHARPRSGA